MILVAKGLTGVKVWSVEEVNGVYEVSHGLYGGSMQSRPLYETAKQIQSRINKKLKQGYVAISNPDNILSEIDDLPEHNTDASGNMKPMKAKTFAINKFNYPCIGQPKINGFRCFIIWGTIVEGEGVFASTKEQAIILSMSGNRYVLPDIEACFTKSMFANIDAYDGELYVPGLKLNEIKKCIPMVNNRGTISKPSGNPKLVQFWNFDLAIDGARQSDRISIIEREDLGFTLNPATSTNLCNHLHIKSKIVTVASKLLHTDADAIAYADECIAAGYEGAVIRDLEAEYAFGQRPKTMMKIKKFQDAEFEVLDITYQKTNGDDVVKFICKNDINDNTFEVMAVGTTNERIAYYNTRENIIGKLATVKFYERSGIKEVPFHANLVTIRDYE